MFIDAHAGCFKIIIIKIIYSYHWTEANRIIKMVEFSISMVLLLSFYPSSN